ncbi:MAG: DUF418 domain-containing protein [Candidatus Acidiferrales bacterium]
MNASAAGPTTASERIELLDVLRGFALFGVLTANLVWVATDFAVTPAQMAELNSVPVDTVATYLVDFFIDWKFYTLFSFLFGLGFAVQMSRAAERGRNGKRIYLRRLTVLLGIGVLHSVFVWYGDVLHQYALLGFLLLACRNASTKKLLLVSATLILLSQTVVSGWPHLKRLLVPVETAGSAETSAPDAVRVQSFQVFTHGSYPAVVREHLRRYFGGFWGSGFAFLFLTAIFGKFLLGLLAGRHRILHDPEQHLTFFRRMLTWGLTIGVLGNAVFVWHFWLERNHVMEKSSAPVLSTLWITDVGLVAMTAFYVSAITLLFRHPAWRARLRILAPVGQMALTNYLTHSIFYVLLFYGYGAGLGLLGKIGAAGCLLLAIVIFGAQIVFSRWWLSRFAFGPTEWLWRSLTYGKVQSMALRPLAASESAAGPGGS